MAQCESRTFSSHVASQYQRRQRAKSAADGVPEAVVGTESCLTQSLACTKRRVAVTFPCSREYRYF